MHSTNTFISQLEGYVETTATGFDYVYQYKDHLEGGALRKGMLIKDIEIRKEN